MGKTKMKKTSISWSPDKILFLAGENKTKCTVLYCTVWKRIGSGFHCRVNERWAAVAPRPPGACVTHQGPKFTGHFREYVTQLPGGYDTVKRTQSTTDSGPALKMWKPAQRERHLPRGGEEDPSIAKRQNEDGQLGAPTLRYLMASLARGRGMTHR